MDDFNVSIPDLIGHAMTRKNLDELQAKVIDLDKRVSVQPDGKYSAFLEGIEKLMFYICRKLKPTGLIVSPKRTGSLYARLKVGLPLETDYVFIIEDLNAGELYFSKFIAELNSCIEYIKYLKYNNAQFKIIAKKKTRVSYCLTFECRDVKNEMREGFSVDIVPAINSKDSQKFKIKYKDGAEEFIHNCEIEGKAYLITLLSTGRDSNCDLGLLKYNIFKSLDDDTRRELRVAKYLATRALLGFMSRSSIGQSLDDTDSKRLFGYSCDISSSFYVCGIFLHILIAAHKLNRTESLRKGVLTLCILELLKRTFEFFATVRHGKRFMHDPLVTDLMYDNHLFFTNNIFHTCATSLDNQIDKFLESKNLDEFNLRVFEKTDTECDRYYHHATFGTSNLFFLLNVS